MRTLCVKIWAVANLMAFVILAAFLLPQGPAFLLTVLLYSSLFSLPAVFLLYALLAFLRFAQGGLVFSWGLLLLGTALSSFVAYSLFRLLLHDATGELDFIRPLSFVCGYSSVIFFCNPLHYWFQKFKYQRYENS